MKNLFIAVLCVVIGLGAARSYDIETELNELRPSDGKIKVKEFDEKNNNDLQFVIKNDVFRWALIVEDYMLDFISKKVMDGLVDKRTLQVGCRMLLKKVLDFVKHYSSGIGDVDQYIPDIKITEMN
eukprot:TRINITY_DN83087_c0_g1_i2.p1 TRINITY_DN83087_c0_g1~~TRINITY_DN83087_c0_g1_i2.p1  ORF type:complete len:126 (-),score=27.88 TRINITY_DN83087_c0_g1_i2:47-424(-)